MSIHDQTTPVALHQLVNRLLADHQRIYPHHADLCPLCQDAELTLDLLADEIPDVEQPRSSCEDDAFEACIKQARESGCAPILLGKA